MICSVLFHLLLSTGLIFDAHVAGDASSGPDIELVRLSEGITSQDPVRITAEVTLGLLQIQPPGDRLDAEPLKTTIDLLGGGRCRYRIGEYEVFIQDEVVLATRDGVDDAYVRMRMEGGAAAAADRLFGSGWRPMLSLIDIDCADAGVESSMKSLICSSNPSIERNVDGFVVAMTWRTPEAVFSLDVEPDGSRPTGAELMLMEGEGVPPGTHLTMEWSWSYEPLSKTSQEWIQRDDRFRVDRLSSLRKLDESGAPIIGEPAPALKCPTLSGETIDIGALRGSVLVIDFWATWCGPCRRALPQLQTLADELSDSPVTVLTVDCFEQKKGQAMLDDVRAMVDSMSLKLPVLIDDDGSVASGWGVEGLPTTFIVDQSGRLHSVHVGAGPDYLQSIRQDVIKILGK